MASQSETFHLVVRAFHETLKGLGRHREMKLEGALQRIVDKDFESVLAGTLDQEEQRLADDEVLPVDVGVGIVGANRRVERRQILLRDAGVLFRRGAESRKIVPLNADHDLGAQMGGLLLDPYVRGCAPEEIGVADQRVIQGRDNAVEHGLHVQAETDDVVLAGPQEILFENAVGVVEIDIGQGRQLNARAVDRVPGHHRGRRLQGVRLAEVSAARGLSTVTDHRDKVILGAGRQSSGGGVTMAPLAGSTRKISDVAQ